ncbi:MAG: Deoxyribodipyrimidine photo-lyase [Phycisphaerae bacterium]|nr:Deoxyribodipyrimidine photo-lyase [Phycisphaerae bacterium]
MAATIVWFRRDLRLGDNAALHAACRRGAVVPVYIHAPAEEGPGAAGAASRVWLHHSLAALDASLRRRGLRLIIRAGDSLDELRRLIAATGADAVLFSRLYEPSRREADEAIVAALVRAGVEVRDFPGQLLFEPEQVRTGGGGPFRVFTAFWKACGKLPAPAVPLPAPRRLTDVPAALASTPLEELDLLPAIDWAGGIRQAWAFGERAAADRLARFARTVLARYATGRDRPDADGTSRLSPHLHFGELSPRQAWHALTRRRGASADAFRRELGWREFAHHLLFHFPTTVDAPLDRRFARFGWRRDAAALRAWQRGCTGYPIVDAGMRQLWRTGWMHNRVRMIAASFLVKDLLLDWRDGAAWFRSTLVDADLANNTLAWQWSAGCGADAAPYFRVFNPVAQGERFDPHGRYVRRWAPELARLPDRWIHHPWDAPAGALATAGVALGRDYPRPIVDHAAARERALAAWRALRG